MPLPRRAAAGLVLGALTVLVALLAGLSIADPFHLRHARWFSLGLVFLAILLLTAALAVAVSGLLRRLVVALGILALLAWAGLGWFASGFVRSSDEVSTVADGDRRLVVLAGTPAPGPVYSVVVRSGGGPIEQESLVYQGPRDAPAPGRVRFVDAGTVEVTVGSGCVYRSEVEEVTLSVSPVHAPLLAGTC